MNQFNQEVASKLELIRQALAETGAKGVRLRGTDWFAWATAGGSNAVLLTAETGVAEILVTATEAWVLTDEIEAQRLADEELPANYKLHLVTATEAWVLTDEIEAQRLADEELPANYKLHLNPWADAAARESFALEATEGGKILSDRPSSSVEMRLSASLQRHKRVIMSSELERYRRVGRLASEAMTEVLSNALPTWTEYQLAGAGAEALWARGLHPALTLVAGERRLPLYRHATATGEAIGREAMLVFCARGYGLYANLTRFVSFGAVRSSSAELHRHVREIEAQALNLCQPGISLDAVYHTLAQAYEQHGYPNAIREHHQGGTTGYLAREIVANPLTTDLLAENMAVAWNPSLPGAKIEDTFIILKNGKLENLTFDPNWPSVEVSGGLRPVPLEVI